MERTFSPTGSHQQIVGDYIKTLAALRFLISDETLLQDISLAILQRLVHMIETGVSHRLGHGQRTASYATIIGEALRLSEHERRDLWIAGLLHDIGLVTVSKNLLHADRALSGFEYALVQSHPRAGAELLKPIPFLRQAALWIAHHHERWDGSGYPYGLRGLMIPLGARILSVADTYDAIVTKITGRFEDAAASAFTILRSLSGNQLDPELAEIFVQSVRLKTTSMTGKALRQQHVGLPPDSSIVELFSQTQTSSIILGCRADSCSDVPNHIVSL